MSEQRKGAEILIECLKEEGVKHLFGYPGGVVLGIYDALIDAGLAHFLVRHEQGGAHMADAYARVSGEVGVCLATSGPGATNLITGLVTAMMDSIPMVALTGQVATHLIGNDAFQEADTVGISRQATKHNYLVKRVEDLPRIIKEAFHIARTGRPGPVLVDLPKDTLNAVVENYSYPTELKMRSYNPTIEGHPGQVKKAVDKLLESSQPLLYVGGGAVLSNATEELWELQDLLGVPLTMTLMGLGAFPGTDERSVGMLGMHGEVTANLSMTYCDMLIAVGARFDDRVTGRIDDFAIDSYKVQIDIDPTSIGKNVPVDLPLVGDCKVVLRQLIDELRTRKLLDFKERIKPWWEKIKDWRKRYPLVAVPNNDALSAPYCIQRLYEKTEGKAIISTDVGQHQMWAAQFYKFDKPRNWATSGGLGTMGYGLPAAIGAQIARPNDLVVCISGDGSFQMNIQELAMAAEHKLPVKVLLLNNGFLGMVRQWQELFFDNRYSGVKFPEFPDYLKLAEAYGCRGLRASHPSELDAAIDAMLEYDGPVVLDCRVMPEENVFPMVPAGGSIRNPLINATDSAKA